MLNETLLGNLQTKKRVQSSRLLQVRNSFLIKHKRREFQLHFLSIRSRTFPTLVSFSV